jgi:hypothetical protein
MSSAEDRLRAGAPYKRGAKSCHHGCGDVRGSEQARTIRGKSQSLVGEGGVRSESATKTRAHQQLDVAWRRAAWTGASKPAAGKKAQDRAASDVHGEGAPRENRVVPRLHRSISEIPQRGAESRADGDEDPVHRDPAWPVGLMMASGWTTRGG